MPPDEAKAIVRFLGHDTGNALQELLDGPFKTPNRFTPARRDRFSDSKLRTFYSALDAETAQVEVQHHLSPNPVSGSLPVPIYKEHITCRFNGKSQDLLAVGWSWLIGDSDQDLAKCVDIAKRAVGVGVDALKTPSPRRASGTNVPVFSRKTLSGPAMINAWRFEFDALGRVSQVVKVT
jgi:hypothetical protein